MIEGLCGRGGSRAAAAGRLVWRGPAAFAGPGGETATSGIGCGSSSNLRAIKQPDKINCRIANIHNLIDIHLVFQIETFDLLCINRASYLDRRFQLRDGILNFHFPEQERLRCFADIDRNPAWVVRTRKDLGR